MKAPADMTASELQKAYDKESAVGSHINRQLIDAGRGHEKIGDTIKMNDPLAVKQREHLERHRALVDEMERRKRYHGSLQKIRPHRWL